MSACQDALYPFGPDKLISPMGALYMQQLLKFTFFNFFIPVIVIFFKNAFNNISFYFSSNFSVKF